MHIVKMGTTRIRFRAVLDATPPSRPTSPSSGNRPSSAPNSRRHRTSRVVPPRQHPPSFARRPATSLPRPRKTLSTTPLTADPPTNSTPSSAASDSTRSPTTITPAPTTARSLPRTPTRASTASRTKAAAVSATRSTSSVPSATLLAASLLLHAAPSHEPTSPSARSGVTLLLLPFALLLLLLPAYLARRKAPLASTLLPRTALALPPAPL